ncbi:Tat pathway signal protein [Streptomyces sp. NBC_01450]|uniref:golvesin C-terminal-like domain-containing protein n=1 Tax=Streptomyces sp. NBC_01450 TaxID=2903871 RepID=UPI002E33DE61|nr:Tat pathway signal protein [Streptomyces sp. NBC_01450]
MVITAATVLIASTFTTSAAQAAIPNPPKKSAQKQAITPEKKSVSAIPLKDRDTVLGKGWKTSADRAVTAVADSDGLHLLAADSTTGYDWKTVTVLSEPQLPADTWIGNSCVMDDHHAAVAYAPRTFTNKPDLMMGGAFTAIVNLDDGSVTKLPFTASLAYFDPTCNPATHTAVFTALRDAKTRLVTVNAKGTTVADTTAEGEITSAVPTKDGVVAAAGNRLVHVDRKGRTAKLAATKHAPYGIRVTGDGTVSYIDRTGDTDANVQTYAHGKKTTVASGRIAAMNLRQGTDGTVYLTGKAGHGKGFASSGIKTLGVSPDAEVSTHGRLAVDPVVSPAVLAGVDRINNAGRGFTATASKEPAAEVTPGHISHALTITGAVPGTGKHTKQKAAEPGSTAGGRPSPALTGSSKPQMSTMSMMTTADDDSRANDPIDTDRWCSVPRNDVATQALQPTPNQVEWAVDMAVQGNLRSGYLTQGGWRSQTGISTIDPQGLFPKPALTGGGRIPAQVQLGILAQESNLWQAESGAIPGQMGSPLAAVDGFYGHQTGGTLSDFWTIRWDKSDCGYGVGQVTDGMRKAGYEKEGETSLPASTQRAVAIDYATNIAASLYILADKWNEVHESGQTIAVNNDDPAKPENWFTAVWNYNLGFNKKADEATNGNWGLGWYNNPANPVYPASRLAFMNTDLDPLAAKDAAHPQNWPYEEKVMGWASWSIDTGHSYATSGRQDWPGESGFSSAGFRPAYWNGTSAAATVQGSAKYNRAHATPPLDAFCNTKNNCNTASPPDCPDADCYKQYWWHESSTTWKSDCATTCGFENIKYQTLISEPGRGTRLQYGTPVCSGAPAGAKVVESVPAGTNTWSSCGTTTTDGSFQFTFYPDPNATGPGLGQYDAKADLHQIGGGYQGHFWYAHARDADHLGGDGGQMTVDGTWKLKGPLDKKQAMVYVHIPDTGAQTQQAIYEVVTALGTEKVTIDQSANESNKWVPLGAFRFNDKTPEVRLSSTTSTGTADKDIAWDAVAFVPGDFDVRGGRMAGLELPDPDDSAADVDFVDDDQQKQPAPSGLVPSALSRSLAGDAECAEGLKNGQGRQCVTFEPLTTPPATARAATATDVLSTPLVPWCAQVGLTQTYTVERREGCLAFTTLVHWTKKDSDGVVETASAAFNVFVETKTSNSATFTERMSVVPVDMDADLGSVSLDYWDTPCTPDCDTTYTTGWSDATWTSLVDKHWASATKANTWTAPTQGTSREFDRGVFLSFKADSPEWQGLVPVDKPEVSLFDQIRCDNGVSVKNSTGCIFAKHIPTFTMTTAKYPAAAAYYWLLREELPSHPGSKEHNTPLHREIDKAVRIANRGKVCPTSYTPTTKATPEATTNSPDGRQCDEYPFAATKESGGQSITNGDECVQLYAQKSDSDGKWRLYSDDDRYPAPTWKEVCGRASMSAKQNEAAGRGLGAFYTKARMGDNDAFYIEAPGVEGCRPDEVCVVNP